MKTMKIQLAIITCTLVIASCKKDSTPTGPSADYGQTSTLAGSGTIGSADGTGAAATFNYPIGLGIDAAGNVYIADRFNHKVRKMTPAGVVTTLAGSGVSGGADGTGAAASFDNPWGIVVDPSGNVYVTELYGSRIRKITPAGVVTTFAGSGVAGSADGTGTAATFNYPSGIVMDASGNLFVADGVGHKIRKITPAAVVTTFAGSGVAGSANGTGTAATFKLPFGLAIDAAGNLYVGEEGNYDIRKITPAGVVTTLAGGTQGSTDGTGAAASFNDPWGLTVDAAGNIIVADTYSHKIRKITSAGVVTTIAGTGIPGSTEGKGILASFNFPNGIVFNSSGDLYVADQSNHKIRKIILH